MNLHWSCLGLLAALAVNANDIYSWVDDKGVTHYSYKAPENAENKNVTKMVTQQKDSFKSVDQIAKEQGKTPSQQQVELEQIAKKNCDIASHNLQILTAFGDITQKDKDGNLVTLSEVEKIQQQELAKKQADIYCLKDDR